MKHSQTIGIIAALTVMVACFLPWISINVNGTEQIFNGYYGKVNNALNFGSQYKAQCFFCLVCIALFTITKIWAKRVNMLFTLLNLSWAIKNFLIFKLCRPECPTVKFGLYTLLISSIVMLVMSLLPKMELQKTSIQKK